MCSILYRRAFGWRFKIGPIEALRKSCFRLKNTGKSVMNRIDFFRRQADRFSALAQECVDRDISGKLLKMASEYREMLNGKGSDDAQDRSITA
jgi:hypothetical protein